MVLVWKSKKQKFVDRLEKVVKLKTNISPELGDPVLPNIVMMLHYNEMKCGIDSVFSFHVMAMRIFTRACSSPTFGMGMLMIFIRKEYINDSGDSVSDTYQFLSWFLPCGLISVRNPLFSFRNLLLLSFVLTFQSKCK